MKWAFVEFEDYRRLRIRMKRVKVRLLSYKEIKCTNVPSALVPLAGRRQSLARRPSSGCCFCWAPDWYLGVRRSCWKQWYFLPQAHTYCFFLAPQNTSAAAAGFGGRGCAEKSSGAGELCSVVWQADGPWVMYASGLMLLTGQCD